MNISKKMMLTLIFTFSLLPTANAEPNKDFEKKLAIIGKSIGERRLRSCSATAGALSVRTASRNNQFEINVNTMATATYPVYIEIYAAYIKIDKSYKSESDSGQLPILNDEEQLKELNSCIMDKRVFSMVRAVMISNVEKEKGKAR